MVLTSAVAMGKRKNLLLSSEEVVQKSANSSTDKS